MKRGAGEGELRLDRRERGSMFNERHQLRVERIVRR